METRGEGIITPPQSPSVKDQGRPRGPLSFKDWRSPWLSAHSKSFNYRPHHRAVEAEENRAREHARGIKEVAFVGGLREPAIQKESWKTEGPGKEKVNAVQMQKAGERESETKREAGAPGRFVGRYLPEQHSLPCVSPSKHSTAEAKPSLEQMSTQQHNNTEGPASPQAARSERRARVKGHGGAD
ncbi:unnamed protein product [Pleuronectes platessa]|uniref:Uncharacterized protein n=1 Tax=Pleuronectes platessa TaxID=8262 RepID=A0A9N7ULJ6_PLEPL|nr:unnamed protein product [Pleuronectes platessa]